MSFVPYCLHVDGTTQHDAPTEFNRLFADVQLEPELIEEVQLLLCRKMAGDELDMGAKVPMINDFLEQQIGHYSNYVKDILVRMSLK